jgi:hypothetical protein
MERLKCEVQTYFVEIINAFLFVCTKKLKKKKKVWIKVKFLWHLCAQKKHLWSSPPRVCVGSARQVEFGGTIEASAR